MIMITTIMNTTHFHKLATPKYPIFTGSLRFLCRIFFREDTPLGVSEDYMQEDIPRHILLQATHVFVLGLLQYRLQVPPIAEFHDHMQGLCLDERVVIAHPQGAVHACKDGHFVDGF